MILCPIKSPYRITQQFGVNPSVYAQFGLKGHNGEDFAGERAGMKVQIYSPYDALLWKIVDEEKIYGVGKGYGKVVRLLTDAGKDGNLREVVLAHLDSFDPSLKEGNRIGLGEKIGIMGTTGFSSGIHLHLGLRRRDPKTLIVLNSGNGYSGYEPISQYLLNWS